MEWLEESPFSNLWVFCFGFWGFSIFFTVYVLKWFVRGFVGLKLNKPKPHICWRPILYDCLNLLCSVNVELNVPNEECSFLRPNYKFTWSLEVWWGRRLIVDQLKTTWEDILVQGQHWFKFLIYLQACEEISSDFHLLRLPFKLDCRRKGQPLGLWRFLCTSLCTSIVKCSEAYT